MEGQVKLYRGLRVSPKDLKSIHELNHEALTCTSNYVTARMQNKDILGIQAEPWGAL